MVKTAKQVKGINFFEESEHTGIIKFDPQVDLI